jgi:hypothetical protein
MLLAIALICARPCLRGLSGSGMRSPIATNKSCRRVAKWAVEGIGVFIFDILQGPLFFGRFHTSVAKRLRIGPCKGGFYLRRKETFNKGARAIIHRNCLLPVLSGGGLKFLVTSFERFGVCRFTAAAIAVHPARTISSAETATNLRPADADDSKPGGHSHDRASR